MNGMAPQQPQSVQIPPYVFEFLIDKEVVAVVLAMNLTEARQRLNDATGIPIEAQTNSYRCIAFLCYQAVCMGRGGK